MFIGSRDAPRYRWTMAGFGSNERQSPRVQLAIKRACAAEHFRPVRSDKELSSAILGDMTAALAMDPMVIAYVGSPPWNPNVMIEIGYRMATRNPIVFLCDALENWEPPFDLHDHQFVVLPPADREDDSTIRAAISAAPAGTDATIPDR